MPTQFAIVGEVIWTKYDYADFKQYYDDPDKKGRLFDWPGAEVVGICPGTGKQVEYSHTTTHLLVVCNMYGSAIRGNSVNILSRLMPRILTLEGYYRMLGPTKKDRRMESFRAASRVNGEAMINSEKEFYPEELRSMNMMRGYSSMAKGGARHSTPMTASMAYDRYHASGEYTQYERYMEGKVGGIRT